MGELKRLLGTAEDLPGECVVYLEHQGPPRMVSALVPLAALRRLVAIEAAAVRVREHERDKTNFRGPRFDGLMCALCEEVDRG